MCTSRALHALRVDIRQFSIGEFCVQNDTQGNYTKAHVAEQDWSLYSSIHVGYISHENLLYLHFKYKEIMHMD